MLHPGRASHAALRRPPLRRASRSSASSSGSLVAHRHAGWPSGAGGGRRRRRPTASLARGVAIAAGATVVALLGSWSQSVVTGRAMDALRVTDALRIQVTGNQWWWEVQYRTPAPSLQMTTANEIHIPVGRPVAVDLLSNDVIHSFWVPELQGKIDLIPGRRNELWLRGRPARASIAASAPSSAASSTPTWRSWWSRSRPTDFERWLAAQPRRRPPRRPRPSSSAARRSSCAARARCATPIARHQRRRAHRAGPDARGLPAHARRRHAAEHARHLAGWIVDPQHLKPGNRMPPTGLDRPPSCRTCWPIWRR